MEGSANDCIDDKLRDLEIRMGEKYQQAIDSLEKRVVELETENKLLREKHGGDNTVDGLPDKHAHLSARVKEIERRFTLVASAAGSISGTRGIAAPAKDRKSPLSPRTPGGRSKEI